ncbi:MAG: chemotaxis protein CheW [Alphaproteobacteria bacterium]
MDDLLTEFLTETAEMLAVLDVEIVRLEQNPNDPDLLSNIFRLVHTIKGTCGFLGLPRLEAVAHAGENILGKFRDGEIEVNADAVTLIFECIDQIKWLLDELENAGEEPDGADEDLIARLNYFADHGCAMGSDGAPAPVVEAETAPAAPAGDSEQSALPAQTDDPFPVAQELLDELIAMGVDPNDPALTGGAPAPTPAAPTEVKAEEPAPVSPPVKHEPPKTEAKPAAAKPAEAKPAAAKAGGEPRQSNSNSVANQSIRVNVDVLETLMTMVSELVLTRNQLLQIVRNQKDSEFSTPLQRLNHVVSELQEGVMKTRMQPIGNAWSKLPRIIRDLSNELDKKIDLQMLGADTELDRQVLELIKDPLTHMVRNSADHGLEMPADRVASGKPETGQVVLNAYHEGGHIIIEIKDDGRGLNTERIKQKALENGIVTGAELETMPESQVHMLIFKAGFSTAEAVTSVSGRGVGMDVVRTNIEKIGGTVELVSVEGQGSTFTIKIPLTLAIVSALIVECENEKFAIPQLSVSELVRASANSEHRIEVIKDTPVLRLRNRLLPLVSLKHLLKLGEAKCEEFRINPDDEHYVVVSQVGSYSFGIIVDRVFDTEEIVVKPVSPILRDIEMFSGNTILGDGSVIMILDPNGIANATGETGGGDTEITARGLEEEADQAGRGRKSALLLISAGGKAPKAVPLSLVARLEDIEVSDIEWSNGYPVVQYRGELMPLVSCDGTAVREQGSQPVIVFTDRDRSMGLIVDEIVDIVEDYFDVQLSAEKDGTMGTTVIAEKATELVDVTYYLAQAHHDWFAADGREAYGASHPCKVLLVDDSAFFRSVLTPALAVRGYQVVAAEGGAEALAALDEHDDIDIVVTDVEMPGMSGYELCAALRERKDWGNKPVFALSSFVSEKDMQKGREAGFDDYCDKSQKESIFEALSVQREELKGAA